MDEFGNGVSEAEELRSLSNLSVASINTSQTVNGLGAS
jgi:hypothetical protein